MVFKATFFCGFPYRGGYCNSLSTQSSPGRLLKVVSVDNLPGQVELSTALPSQSPVGYVGVDDEMQGLMETIVY